MGSEGTLEAVHFNITGFGKFHGVADNPTKTLVLKLREYMKKQAGPPVLLESCTVLEVAGVGGLDRLLELLNEPLQQEAKVTSSGKEASRKLLAGEFPKVPTPAKVVWIHMGVNGSASRIALERRAYNEATFRCPDEEGWQPWKQPIVPDDGPIDHYRETTLPVDLLVDTLRKQGFDCAPSTDAGRFVCNFVYYQSLRHAAAHGAEAIFLHVPDFAVIGEEIQLKFVAALLKILNALYSSVSRSGDRKVISVEGQQLVAV